MSDIVLTQIAYDKASKSIEEVIKIYNNEELTIKGKRESLLDCVALSFMAGYKLRDEQVKKLQSDIEDEKENVRVLLYENQKLQSDNQKMRKALEWVVENSHGLVEEKARETLKEVVGE